MNFELSDEQKLIQHTAREFARREVLPVAAQCDRDASFPLAVAAKAREVGVTNMTVPTEYGGSGWGVLEQILVGEELAWACAGIAGGLGLNAIFGDVFQVAGSAAQKKTAFGRMLAGEFGAYAVTEPSAGSDVAGIKTRAERKGDRYVINGSKVWISNAPLASMFVVFAKTDPEARHKGISAFFIDRDTPGLSVGKPLGKLGQRADPAAEVFLNDVEVPASALLDGEGAGFMIAMKVFDRSRPGIAALGVGLMQRCLDESLEYAKTRRTMGKPIIEHQAIAHKIADMAVRTQAARCWRISRRGCSTPVAATPGRPPTPSCSRPTAQWPLRSKRCRSSAAWATAPSTRSRSCSATPRCCRSTKAAARSSATSSPASCPKPNTAQPRRRRGTENCQRRASGTRDRP